MTQTKRPTAREAKVGRCSPAGNADWKCRIEDSSFMRNPFGISHIKKPSPAAAQAAGFGGVGFPELRNRYAAELGTTSGCHRFDKIQVTETGTQIQGSGNGKRNSKALAVGEIPAAAFAENSGDGQESATGSLGSGYGVSGFQGFLEPPSSSNTSSSNTKTKTLTKT